MHQVCAIRGVYDQMHIGLAAGAGYQQAMNFVRFLIVVLTLALASPGLRAQSVVENEYTTTEIIAEARGFEAGKTLWFAIRQELRPGWHVFWTNPGDAGLPLRLDWTLPDGFESGAVEHPAPVYIPVGPLASYAHEGAPVFLVSVTAPETAAAGDIVDVAIDASWQACEDICVPEEGRFEFSVPVDAEPQTNTAYADIFAAARAALPEDIDADAGFAVEGGAYRLELAAPAGFDSDGAFYFAGAEGLIEPSGAQQFEQLGERLRVTLRPGWVENFDAPALDGVLTFVDVNGARRAYAFSAALAAPIAKPREAGDQPSAAATGLGLLLVFAFFGGVILNVMPCVFPIVFIKAAAFMTSAREQPAIVRRDGMLYTAGVLATFLLIGGALLALRAGGEQFGWGFHLQSPAVVALSAYVLLLVALNLAGMFTIGGGLAGAGEGLAAKSGGAGAFFTGALAVVVAAPCIGPLLSAPMGAALLLPPLAGLAIFATLGLGLAAPYLLLSFAPGLGARLPRPGPWMIVFKQALAFPVIAAAAYFIWVLAQQVEGAALGAVLAGAVLIAFSAWAFELSKGEGKRALILRALAAVAAVSALAPLMRIEARSPPSPTARKRSLNISIAGRRSSSISPPLGASPASSTR